MAIVKVRNLNAHPFNQKFKGIEIHIAPNGQTGDYVEMDSYDAEMFLGQYSPVKPNNKGQQDPKSFKWLKIERDPKDVHKEDVATNGHRCPACTEQTSSWLELEAHMKIMHADSIVKDEAYYASQKAKTEHGNKSAGAVR